jgi:hypothetical protein
VFGGARGTGFQDAPLLGAIVGAGAGAVNSVMLAGTLFAAEIFLPPTRLGVRRWKQPPEGLAG